MRIPTYGLVLTLLAPGGCSSGTSTSQSTKPPVQTGRASAEAVEAPGLHNVYRLTDRLYSGSSPEGDQGFASLRRLGIKTVISVDGARPDLDRARQFDVRYVHLPVGYDGIPERQALRIARAARDRPGPVYVHCHHGKHRGPAAAAMVRLCLDDSCGVDAALSWLRQAGTDPCYAGLYAAPQQLRRPKPEDLDRVSDDFPEAAEVAALAQTMVDVDERWENLKQVKAAGWKVPLAHPDIDPPHEALQLVELYREAARPMNVKGRPEEFRRWLADAEDGVQRLEAILRRGKLAGAVDVKDAEKLFQEAAGACARCHGKYRDLPKRPSP